jgi:hypothetical protein
MFNKIKKTIFTSQFFVFAPLASVLFFSACQEQDDNIQNNIAKIDDEAEFVEETFLFSKLINIYDASGVYFITANIQSNDQYLLENYEANTKLKLGIIYPDNDPFSNTDKREIQTTEKFIDFNIGLDITPEEIFLPEEALGYYFDVEKSQDGEINKRIAYTYWTTYNSGKDWHYGKVDWFFTNNTNSDVYVHWQYRNSKLKNWSEFSSVEILNSSNISFEVYYSGKYLKAICESNWKNHRVYFKKGSADGWSEDAPE